MTSVFDILALLYSVQGLFALWRWIRSWREFWDETVTQAERSLAGQIAFFILIPLGVFLHEAGHAVATWQVGGQVVDFQWRVFWGYVIPLGDFTPLEDWWISLAGPLVSLIVGLLPIPLITRVRQRIAGELLYSFAKQQILYSTVWYPVLSAFGIGGDWIAIYNFAIAPWAYIVAATHAALLFGLWRLDRSVRAAEWRLAAEAGDAAVYQKLKSAAELQPADAGPLLRLARYGWQAGEPQLAQHYLEQAQRLAPESSALIAVQALLAFGRRDHRRAERLARAALAGPLSAEDNVTLRVALADYYSKTGRHRDAIEQLDAAILQYPHNGRLYQWRGLARRALGQGAEARADFERAIEHARSEADRFEAQRALRATGAPER